MKPRLKMGSPLPPVFPTVCKQSRIRKVPWNPLSLQTRRDCAQEGQTHGRIRGSQARFQLKKIWKNEKRARLQFSSVKGCPSGWTITIPTSWSLKINFDVSSLFPVFHESVFRIGVGERTGAPYWIRVCRGRKGFTLLHDSTHPVILV